MKKLFNDMSRQEQDDYIKKENARVTKESYQEYLSFQPENPMTFVEFGRLPLERQSRLIADSKRNDYKRIDVKQEKILKAIAVAFVMVGVSAFSLLIMSLIIILK